VQAGFLGALTRMYERGAEAIDFLARVLKGEIAPVMHLEQLPMMIPTCSTDLEPGTRLNALCREWEQQPGMIDCMIFHGFPYTDVPAVGMSVLTITDNDPALAAAAFSMPPTTLPPLRQTCRQSTPLSRSPSGCSPSLRSCCP